MDLPQVWHPPRSRHQRRKQCPGRGTLGGCLWRDCKTWAGKNPSRQVSTKQEGSPVREGIPWLEALGRMSTCLLVLSRRGIVLLTCTNSPNFFCDVNTNRTPGDTASTAHTARCAKLVNPACQLVRHPLAVARAWR